MKIDTAADLAAVLDPNHEVAGWWQLGHMTPHGLQVDYIGPPDLHTAREYAYLMEEWLEGKRYSYVRQVFGDDFNYTIVRDAELNTISNHTNHSAALVAAIERVAQ